jgi:hypothetical protein
MIDDDDDDDDRGGREEDSPFPVKYGSNFLKSAL